jgi:hypothetical protein
MAEKQIWGTLGRAVNDNTLIDEAIAIATEAHNDDPDAHLEAGQSLTTHRAAEIIDHLAESVVNDKLAAISRAYTAIVGSGLEGDFDTIESAVAYVIGVGGGTILLNSGTYYLSSKIDLPSSVNVRGIDVESVIIHGDYSTTKYFNLIDDIVTNQIDQIIENITFVNDGGGVFRMDSAPANYDRRNHFNFCNFAGGGNYIDAVYRTFIFDYCNIQMGGAAALKINNIITLTNSNITVVGTPSTAYLVDYSAVYDEVVVINIRNCVINGIGATNAYIFPADVIEELLLIDTTIYNWNATLLNIGIAQLTNNYISLKSGTALTYAFGATKGLWCNNTFANGAIPNVIINGDNMIFANNQSNGQITNTGADNIILNNTPFTPFKIAVGTDTAMAFGLRGVVEYTPNGNRTLTTTIPYAGTTVKLIILTSGVTSYTLTFGTGFKATCTLATGTTSARYFVVEFVSDGTYLIETSRTVAIA